MKRVLMVAASALMAAALNGDVTGGTPALAAAAAPATQGEKTLEEICREGPRSREVEIQKIEPFKVFDNLYHVGPCYVSVWILTTPEGHIMFHATQEPFIEHTLANIAKAPAPGMAGYETASHKAKAPLGRASPVRQRSTRQHGEATMASIRIRVRRVRDRAVGGAPPVERGKRPGLKTPQSKEDG